MASNATLTIKVGANVKDAAQQLQALGYNIESVKKKTDTANDSASIWQQTLKKGADDNIKNIVNLGAKYLTVATVVAATYKGIKSCVSEALKENKEAQEKIDKINAAWTGVKANLGNALLDTVTPALETLYKWLTKIEEWSKSASSGISYNSMLSGARAAYQNGTKYDVSNMSRDELIYATGHLPDNVAYTRREPWIMELANSLVEALANADNDSSSGSAGASTSSSSYGLKVHKTAINELYALGRKTNDGWLPDIAAALSEAQTQLDGLKDKLADADDADKVYIDLAISSVEEYIAALKDAQQAQIDLLNNCMSVANGIMDVWNNATDLKVSLLDEEIEKVENSEASEEEKAVKLDDLKRRQFEAEKRNSIANATVSTAEAVIKAYATYMANPAMMWTMIGLATAAGALQIGAIASQEYTGLASGGIVQAPTHALIGEGAEKEAVIPLSKLEDFVNRDAREGAIVLNITCNGSSSEDDVFRAIERAQRTGLLPAWRYTR